MPRLPGPVLRTERLVLRVPKPQDVDVYYRHIRDPRVIKYLAWTGPRSRADVADIAARAKRRQRAGLALQYMIHHAEAREPIGACTVRELHDVHRSGDLGYWLARPYWGRGLMPEALAALCAHAFTALGLHRITAGVMVQNRQSTRALHKLGFHEEATARHDLRKRNRYYDVLWLSLLATDPGARRLIRSARGARVGKRRSA